MKLYPMLLCGLAMALTLSGCIITDGDGDSGDSADEGGADDEGGSGGSEDDGGAADPDGDTGSSQEGDGSTSDDGSATASTGAGGDDETGDGADETGDGADESGGGMSTNPPGCVGTCSEWLAAPDTEHLEEMCGLDTDNWGGSPEGTSAADREELMRCLCGPEMFEVTVINTGPCASACATQTCSQIDAAFDPGCTDCECWDCIEEQIAGECSAAYDACVAN